MVHRVSGRQWYWSREWSWYVAWLEMRCDQGRVVDRLKASTFEMNIRLQGVRKVECRLLCVFHDICSVHIPQQKIETAFIVLRYGRWDSDGSLITCAAINPRQAFCLTTSPTALVWEVVRLDLAGGKTCLLLEEGSQSGSCRSCRHANGATHLPFAA